MSTETIVKRVVLGFFSLVLILFFFGSYTVINPGYTGVLFNTMSGSLRTTGQGITFKAPFFTRVQSYPIALRTYTMVKNTNEGSSKDDDSLDLPTLEGQHIRQDLSVTYNTSEEKAAEVFKNFKGSDIEDIENTFIRRTIITVAQNASGNMSLTEIISSKRGALQATIQEKLNIELTKMGFNLDKVNMGASHLPEAIEKQMQQKMAAQQDAQKAEYEMQKETTLAKAVTAKAHGEADANLIKAKAQAEANNLLQKTLTAELVRMKAIEAWDGRLPMISGGGSMPIINLDTVMREQKGR